MRFNVYSLQNKFTSGIFWPKCLIYCVTVINIYSIEILLYGNYYTSKSFEYINRNSKTVHRTYKLIFVTATYHELGKTMEKNNYVKKCWFWAQKHWFPRRPLRDRSLFMCTPLLKWGRGHRFSGVKLGGSYFFRSKKGGSSFFGVKKGGVRPKKNQNVAKYA